MKDSGKSREHGLTLLVHGRKITADATKGSNPRLTAKGASNLLLNFRHPKIALRLIVGKRDREVIEQSEHLISSVQQDIQEVFGRTVSAPALALSLRFAGRRPGAIASSQDLKIAGSPFIALRSEE